MMRIYFPMSVLVLLLSMPSDVWAFCYPASTTCAAASDKTCDKLGTSTMDFDHQNIVVCLATSAGDNCSAGQCQWKTMTSAGGIGQCYTVTATAGQPASTALTAIDGFSGSSLSPSAVVSVKMGWLTTYPFMKKTTSYVATPPATATCQSGYERVSCIGVNDAASGVASTLNNDESGGTITLAYNNLVIPVYTLGYSDNGCIGGSAVSIVCCKSS